MNKQLEKNINAILDIIRTLPQVDVVTDEWNNDEETFYDVRVVVEFKDGNEGVVMEMY